MPREEISTTLTTLGSLLEVDNPYCDHVLIQARSTNTGIIECGAKDDCIIELAAGGTTTLSMTNLNAIAIKADAVGQIANIIIVRK